MGFASLTIPGQGRAGKGRAGQGRAGQGRAGQGRAGQGWAGQGWAGQGGAGRPSQARDAFSGKTLFAKLVPWYACLGFFQISITRNQSTNVLWFASLRQPFTGSLKSGPNNAVSKSFTYLQRQSTERFLQGTNSLLAKPGMFLRERGQSTQLRRQCIPNQ